MLQACAVLARCATWVGLPLVMAIMGFLVLERAESTRGRACLGNPREVDLLGSGIALAIVVSIF